MKKYEGVAWFSAGAASAVTCILNPQMRWVYIDIATAHPDNKRFIDDVERTTGHEIERVRSKTYTDQFDVIRKRRFIKSPFGAPCSTHLKREVRESMNISPLEIQAFGFTMEERTRAKEFKLLYPDVNAIFPLIQFNFTKFACKEYLNLMDIELPRMYRLGYSNNNCIGCVKGGKKYWQKIREDFPAYFKEMSKLERQLNHSVLKDTFLDQLPPGAPLFADVPECSGFCAWH